MTTGIIYGIIIIEKEKKGKKKMEIITMVLGIALLITGFGLMDYNMTHDAKHNIATGFFAYMFLLIGFTLTVYRFF